MTSMRRALAFALLAAGLTTAPAAAATLDEPVRATPIDADGGFAVWSVYDAEAKGFRLRVRPPSGATWLAPVAPSPVPFEADLGGDAQGRMVVAYNACPSGPQSCDVRVLHLSDGRDERIAVASRPGVWEHSPTVSGGRIAWSVGGGESERPRVLLGTLAWPEPPREVPALPRRRCGRDYEGRSSCATVHGVVSELELRGNLLVQTAVTILPGFIRTRELRLVDIDRGTSKQLLSINVGESGQSLIGASLDGGAIYLYKTCFGDPGGCERRAGTLRYRLADGALHLAQDAHQLSGFSVDRGRVFAAEGSERSSCELEQGDYPTLPNQKTGPCPIEERALPARWARVKRR